jgi:hypothetical protein
MPLMARTYEYLAVYHPPTLSYLASNSGHLYRLLDIQYLTVYIIPNACSSLLSVSLRVRPLCSR